jgi:hypothetical protein
VVGIPSRAAFSQILRLEVIPALSLALSRKQLKLRGRAQAPTPAFNLHPAFAFALFYHASRSKCAKLTGQILIISSASLLRSSQKKEIP